ncbi:MAG TPA: transglutaminase family protein [Gemmataceae bacterium]|jgi:regulator of sirC expression with transglutaminase-like and TPR domain|nr:transglutaminase family protein [Gemmataceae bacterium]
MSRHAIALLLIATASLAAADKTAEELAEQVKPSLCVITTRGRDVSEKGLGTGFVISPDGLIATNAHVIGEGRPIAVEFADGKKFDVVAVHAHDQKRDLAIIKIDAKGLKPLELGDSDAIKDGQPVVAFGNPKGLKFSVVSGVVSASREVETRKMIQLAIAVEPGNSGGPVVDARGHVLGIVSIKSLVTENLAFAVAINELKPLVQKPNPVAMAAWATIGALDPDEWKSEMDARWTQRAGRLRVEQPGSGFGGRSICVWQRKPPALPFDVTVTVKLDDEKGAAGLIFRHDGEKHYGFYPTGGKLRLTRFDGPDVYSWKILHDVPNPHYKQGEWNTLRVRIAKDGVKCFVNGQLAIESNDAEWADGQVGLAKFRDTKAEFRNFRVGSDLAPKPADAKTVLNLVDGKPSPDLVGKLAKEKSSTDVLRARAEELEKQAAKFKELAGQVQERRVYDELQKVLSGSEPQIDLIHAALLLAKLDNEEVDIDAYRTEVERMAKKAAEGLAKDATDEAKLKALNTYFFEKRGFHGSRGNYYHRSNSYLNEVIDDREGLPITLCVLYLDLARRMGVTVVGIGLPGHFVARHMPKEGEAKFIDVFERAELLTAEQAKKKAKDALDREVDDEVLKPVTKKAIVVRMLHNLLGLAQRDQDTTAGLRYLNGILILDPSDGQSRMMRAGIHLSKDQKPEALADVQYLIDHPVSGIDRRKLEQFKRGLEGE